MSEVTDVTEVTGPRSQNVSHPPLSALVWAVWLCVALAGLIPLYLISVTGPSGSPVWWLAWTVAAWSGGRLAVIVARARPVLYDYIFWLFTYVFIGLPSLVQLRDGAYPATTPGVVDEFHLPTLIVVILGIAAYEVGRLLPRLDGQSRRSSLTRTSIDSRRVVVLTIAGLMIATYYVATIGPAALLSSRDSISALRASLWPNQTIASMVWAASFMPLLVAVHATVLLRRQGQLRSAGATALLVGALGTLLLVTNPVVTPRYVFGTVGLSLLALLGAFKTRERTRMTLVGVLVTILVVFPYADIFRRDVVDLRLQTPVFTLTKTADFDGYAQITNTLVYVERGHQSLGRQAAGAALFWVPRTVWPDKPRDTGDEVGRMRGYRYTNLSAPLWSEAYINGGHAAVIGVFLGLGVLARRWDVPLSGGLFAPTVRTITFLILPFYGLILLRGSLLQAMGYLAVMFSALWFVRRRSAPDD